MDTARTYWIAYTNSDLTEGRGWRVPLAICSHEMTARRLARKAGVQGTDGVVVEIEALVLDGRPYLPVSALYITGPSGDDIINQKIIDNMRVVLAKAKAAGLTDEDIKALVGLKEL